MTALRIDDATLVGASLGADSTIATGCAFPFACETGLISRTVGRDPGQTPLIGFRTRTVYEILNYD